MDDDTNGEDRFEPLRRQLEERALIARWAEGIEPPSCWQCPGCLGDQLMMHEPVWLTGSVDQRSSADRPAFDNDTDIYESIRGLRTEFECCDCDLKFLEPVAVRGNSSRSETR